MKHTRITTATLAILLTLIVQSSNIFAQKPVTPADNCVSGNCVNGIGKMVHANGDIYEGDFVNGNKQGKGTYTFKNGQVYLGQFNNNLRNGSGKFTFANGNVYEGSFISDNFIGQGTFTKSGINHSGKFTVGEIVDLQSRYVDTYWGKAEIIEIQGDKFKVRDLRVKTIEVTTAQNIRPFTVPDKYEIGQKVEVMDKGIWYKGEIIGKEVEYNDHYRIRFEGTTNRSDLSENVQFIRPLIAASTAQTKAEYSSPLWVEKFGISEQQLTKRMLADANELYDGCTAKYNSIMPPTRLETPSDRAFSNEGGGFGEQNKILLTYAIGNANLTRIKIIESKRNRVRYTAPQMLVKIRETGENNTKINFNSIALEFVGSDSYQIEAEPNNDDYTGIIKLVCNARKSTFATGNRVTPDSAANSAPTTTCVSGNCLNGFGKYLFANGNTYEGYFVNGRGNGKGKVVNADGSSYVGDFVNGKMEGRGIFLSANGNTYDGMWANNVRSGEGKQTIQKTGEYYVGQFAGDKRHGKGKVTYKNGDSYDGDWVNGAREGQATYTFPNGSYYIGGFLKDKQHGTGKQFNKLTGNMTEGTWKDGAFINTPGVTKITPNAPAAKLPIDGIATQLRETLNGKYDYLDNKPLTYIFTNKKTNEVLRYQIEFIEDGGKLAFRWKESTKKEQSEKLVITDAALASATKYVNFFSTKTAIARDTEIAFILSQKLHKDMKYKDEISLDLGSGVKRFYFIMGLTASSGTYTDKNVKVLRYQADDGVTKIQILDDPMCPLIVKIETAEYTLTLV